MALLDTLESQNYGMLQAPMPPTQQGLLSAGLGMMAQAGPSRMPVSLAQAVGNAGQQGLVMRNAAENQQMNRAMAMETLKSQDMIRQAQAAQLEEVVADRKRKAEAVAGMTAAMNEVLKNGGDREAAQAAALPFLFQIDPVKANEGFMQMQARADQLKENVRQFDIRIAEAKDNRELQAKLQRDRLEEIARHNRVTEGLTAAMRAASADKGQIVQTADGIVRVTGDKVTPLNGPDGKPLMPVAQGDAKAPNGYRWGPKGADGQPTLEPIPGGPGDKLTEVQGNATAFGMRAVEADKGIKDLIAKGFNPSGGTAAKDWLTTGTMGANWLASKEGQDYIANGKNFMAAILRKESGAAISNSEWDMAKQIYIPLPGDKRDVIELKAKNRALAVETMRVQAGPGGRSIPTVDSQKPWERDR